MTRRRRCRARQHAPDRLLERRLEADAGQQHGVGQEGMQLAEVFRPAMGQVGVRLGCDPDRHGRQLHQRRVGRLLAAEHHHRLPGRPKPVESTTEHLGRAQDPRHDQVASLQHRRELGVRRPGRVCQDIVGATCPRGEQVGIRGGQQGDARHHGSLTRSAAPI